MNGSNMTAAFRTLTVRMRWYRTWFNERADFLGRPIHADWVKSQDEMFTGMVKKWRRYAYAGLGIMFAREAR